MLESHVPSTPSERGSGEPSAEGAVWGRWGWHAAEGGVKIHRYQHGRASWGRWKEDSATRRHYDHKAELSPEKPLLFVRL